MLSPPASTSPAPAGTIPGLRLPRRRPVYSWQFTQSRQTSHGKTTNNSSLSSRSPSPTQRQSRWARPGTLTRTELLGFPSRPLWWLAPLTPTTFPSLPQPSSSSRGVSKSKRLHRPTATRNAPTATDSDTPMPDAPRSTPPAPIGRFIILAQPTGDKTPHAPKAATLKPFPAAALPPPPTAPIAATTTMPSPEHAGLDKSRLLNLKPQQPLTKSYPPPPPIVRKPWMWATMAALHLLLPKPLQPRPLTFPPPDPSVNPRTITPPPAGPSRHPLARACRC